MREKFGRRLRGKETFGFDFDVDFEVESYLRYRGSQFVTRFDANSYLYITKAMDYFDLTSGNGSLAAAFEQAQRALPGDQLHLRLALSELSIAGDRARAALRAIATWRIASCSRTTATMRFWWTSRSRRELVRGFPRQHVRETAHERADRHRSVSSANCSGRSDYAIIGEIVEPRQPRARSRLRRRRTAGVAREQQAAWMRAASRSPAPRCSRAIARGVSVFQGDIDEGAGRLSRPGVRLRDPQPDAAGDAPSAAGAARDAARRAARDRRVSELRPLDACGCRCC